MNALLPLLLSTLANAAPPGDATAAAALEGRVLFDEPGDGSLWAVGGTKYKARFERDAVTYIPYFGAGAPRNYPVRFELVSAALDGVELPLSDGAPERVDRLVAYDRGALVEYYELSPDSIEQKFRVDAVAGPGELVLRVAVESELACETTAEGLRFSNELGAVGYSSAVVLDAHGRASAAPTSWKQGAIEIRVPEDFVRTAALPLTIDPIVQTMDVTDTQDMHETSPDVAYDPLTDRFVVVFERVYSATDHDVYSELYASDGSEVIGSTAYVDSTTDCWRSPSVANMSSAAQFLVVASTSPDCGGASHIEGRTRGAAGNLQGAQFRISPDWDGQREHPDVGGNSWWNLGTYYCVVYEAYSAGSDWDVFYQLVDETGALMFAEAQALTWGDAFGGRYPSVSKTCGSGETGPQQWTVAWQVEDGLGDWDVRGAQIHWTGDVTHQSFPIADSAQLETRPQVSSVLDGGNGPRPYLVTYDRGASPTRDLWGTVLAGDQTLVPPTNLSALEGGAYLAQDQAAGAIDSDGTYFAVTYREHFFNDPANFNVYVSSFRLVDDELVPVEVHEDVGISFDDQRLPALTAMNGPLGWSPDVPGRFLLSWEEERTLFGNSDVEAALYDLDWTPGAALCFGDGAACPCGNGGGPGEGCLNTSGRGCLLSAQGTASVNAADLALVVEGALPGQPGLFFQGHTVIGGGQGVGFGDGLRCCGQGVVRLQVVVPAGDGGAASSVPVAATGGASSGDTRCYQFWYRDPSGGGVCGNSFNLSNAVEVRWSF